MRRSVDFTKMHGTGNDFVVLDGIRDDVPLDLSRIAALIADRHFGIGCDQVLVARPSDAADVRMDIYDADGSQVEMCGNGIRALLKFMRDHGHTDAEEISVETTGGVVRPRWMGNDRVRVDMGVPVLAPAKIPTTLGSEVDGPVLAQPLKVAGQTFEVSVVSMGNPHCVVYVDDVDAFPVTTLGPEFEVHAAFPNRVNTEFVQIVDREHVRQRTWERGTGETLSCGTGACAVAVASILNGLVDRDLRVELRGGELRIEWPSDDAHVIMTGPAAEVFRGTIEVELESEES